jgi:Tfp pilus assembly PilM family ATPase
VNNGLNFDRAHPRYLKIIADLTDGLVEEIKKIMMFYQEHFKEASPITRVSLCGGMARLKNLAPVISRKLKVSARPDSVWKNLLNPQIKEKESDLVLASAVGLALRAAENPLKEKKLAL